MEKAVGCFVCCFCMAKASFRSTVIEKNYEALGKALFSGRQLPTGQVQINSLGRRKVFPGFLFIKIRFPNPAIL